MSQWINKLLLPSSYLALLLVVLFFTIRSQSLLAGLLLLILLVQLLLRYSKEQVKQTFLVLLAFSLFFSGQSILEQQREKLAPNRISQIRLLPDTIKINGDSLSFRGKSQGRLYQVFYKLPSEEEQKFFKNLTEVTDLRIEASLEKPAGRRNFSGFDYAAYLKTQGIDQIVTIERIQTSQSVQTFQPFELLSSLRRRALVWSKEKFPTPMNNYMTGLLFGSLDTDFEEMNDLYSSLGIIHLFALSGMQVGFFLDTFRRILLRLGLKNETVKHLLFPFSFIYAALTGFSVSVVRSLIQRLLGQMGVGGKDNFPLTILLLFILMPNFLLTTGGVLSCAYAFLLAMLDFENQSSVKKILLESATLSLGVLPILLFYFSEFQPWSVILTFLFSLLFDSIMLPGLTLVFLISPLFAFTQLNSLFLLLERGIAWIGSIAPKPLIFGQPKPWQLLALLILLALVYDFWQKKTLRVILIVAVISLFVLIKYPLDNEVTMLDVGSGKSLLLRDWRGKTILVNTGGSKQFEVKEKWKQRVRKATAEKTLIPYLKSRGVSQIDSLLLTNTDPDYIGDFTSVLKAFAVKEIYLPIASMNNENFLSQIQKSGAKLHFAQEGEKFSIMGSQLELFTEKDQINLYGHLLHKNILLASRLEQEDLQAISYHYPTLKTDVLATFSSAKLDDHKTLSFLQQLQAKLFFISSDKSKYSDERGEDSNRQEISFYQTSKNGAIRLRELFNWKLETVN